MCGQIVYQKCGVLRCISTECFGRPKQNVVGF